MDRTLLHVLFKGDVEATTSYFVKHPHCLAVKNENGQLPIHCAVVSGSVKFPTIKYMVKMYLLSLFVPDNEGNFPLHHAATSSTDRPQVLQLLLESNPSAANAQNTRGYIPFQTAILLGRFTTASLLLLNHSGTACVNNRPLLQFAILHGAPETLLRDFCAKFPECHKLIGEKGDFPLHFAIRKGKPIATIRLLLEECPDAVQFVNQAGQVPLKLAYAVGASREVVDLLSSYDFHDCSQIAHKIDKLEQEHSTEDDMTEDDEDISINKGGEHAIASSGTVESSTKRDTSPLFHACEDDDAALDVVLTLVQDSMEIFPEDRTNAPTETRRSKRGGVAHVIISGNKTNFEGITGEGKATTEPGFVQEQSMALSSVFLGCCLRPSYSLRQQLLLSFGSATVLTLFAVAILASVCGDRSGHAVTVQADELLRRQVVHRLTRNSVFVVDTLSSYIYNIEGMVQLATEIVQDRIVGYPSDAGWEDDAYVPFYDQESESNKYPLASSKLPLDWEIDINIDLNNEREHLGERAQIGKVDLILDANDSVSLLSSMPSYFFQGVCNPSAIDPEALAYYPNCTSANNDYTTGGVVQPTRTSRPLYEKAADIGTLLKPIYEVQRDIRKAGVYFHNSGAGSMVQYPGNLWSDPYYVSEGCDWMKKINPHSGRPFGTLEEIARCHVNGTLVPSREFNPMELPEIGQMAVKPGVTWGYTKMDPIGGFAILSVGRGVFDRRTKNFVGCVAFKLQLLTLNRILEESKLNNTDLAAVRYDDSSVLADTLGDTASRKVTETGLISKENYDEVRKLFENRQWGTRKELMEELRNKVFCFSDAMYTAYPVPLPPEDYDAEYEPEFLIIHKISFDVLAAFDKINKDIDTEIRSARRLSFGLAAGGIVVTFVILWYVSGFLTRPLLWIEEVAWGIVNHDDESTTISFRIHIHDYQGPKTSGNCQPSTEIAELVHEFQSMIKGFSGKGASQMAHADLFEIPNQLTWQSDYQQLYQGSPIPEAASMVPSLSVTQPLSEASRTEADEQNEDGEFKEHDEAAMDAVEYSHELEVFVPPIVPAPPKKNLGSNLRNDEIDDSKFKKGQPADHLEGCKCLPCRSSLFWWVLLLIVAPMVATNGGICYIVSSGFINAAKTWVQLAEDESLKLEIESLISAAALKSTQAQTSTGAIIGDLHIANRLAGWLFFGGVRRSSSFTQMEETTQECRGYEFEVGDPCPVFRDPDRTPCACEWEDVHGLNCTDVNYTDPRLLQRRFFYVQARDFDNVTGNRDEATSYGLPGVDDSPNATLWWDDEYSVPGSGKEANASGFETTYDRLRVSSAMAVVEMPIYNYLSVLGFKKHLISTFISFDADGMMTGYSGCASHKHAYASDFQSNNETLAYEINSKLCPLGKFGFDPRCREWYTLGKKLYEHNRQPVHVTAPYLYAYEDHFATSATAPVANPKTGEYVGQTLLDFSLRSLCDMFEELSATHSFVVTPGDDLTGGDTVVGPEGCDEQEAKAIGDLIFLNEASNSSNRLSFESGILTEMKRGESGVGEYMRMDAEGITRKVNIAFKPVSVDVHLPLDPSEFARGTNSSTIQVYSVGIAHSEDEIRHPWKLVEDHINNDLLRLRTIYLSVICCLSVLFIVFSCHITVKVTTPMITLLKIVQSVNAGMTDDDIPPLQGGSRESQQVYNAFAKLFKIVRISNVLVFSGNLRSAYKIIMDALNLFSKIEDTKAIGIASNNLGNILHTMCSSALYVEDCCTNVPGICTVKEAHDRYNKAIEIAQDEFDAASGDEQKADFAQQLADRLFNRGLFLLLVANDRCAPDDARQTGLSDIGRVRALDNDVKEFWLERHLLLQNSHVYFYRLIRRTVGLFDFYEDEQVRAIWDLAELVEDADRFLFVSWDQPSAPLFKHVSRAGRLQQLEALAMLVDVSKGRNVAAASLAMRMFVEDEYILESAFRIAAGVLLKITRDEEEWSYEWSTKTKKSVKSDLRKMLRSCKQTNLDAGKCLIVALEISKRWEASGLLDKVNENLLKLYDDCCLVDDHMGVVASDMNVPLSVKSENEGLQRTGLDIASSSTSERATPSFPSAVQMLVDSVIPDEVDTYILLLADGVSWDVAAQDQLKAQIERTNRERGAKIHVFILGMSVDDTVREYCQMMCSVSKKSMYKDIDATNIDTSFEEVRSMIRGCVRSGCSEGLTMEKF